MSDFFISNYCMLSNISNFQFRIYYGFTLTNI